MIKKTLEQLNKEMSRHAAHFSVKGKKEMRERIFMFMKEHPIFSVAGPLRHFSLFEDVRFGFPVFTRLRVVGAATLVLTLTLGGSVSYAAQSALPGDSLYGVKTNVNEEIRSFLTLSSKEEAKLHIEFAEERIKEAEKLAKKGKIKTETAQELQDNFKKHADKVEEKISELESQNKPQEVLEVSSQFESSLSAHESVLASLKDQNTEVTNIIGSVEDQIDTTSETRSDAETKVQAEATVDKDAAVDKMTIVKAKINDVSSLIEDLEERLPEDTVNQAKRNWSKSEKTYASGREKYLKKVYSDAFVFFEEANRQAEEVKTYLNAQLELSQTAADPLPTATSTATTATSTEAQGGATATSTNATTTPHGEGDTATSTDDDFNLDLGKSDDATNTLITSTSTDSIIGTTTIQDEIDEDGII